MTDRGSIIEEVGEIPIKYVRHQFDGVRFLWKTPETRFLLKLIITLFSSMIIFYAILYFLLTFLSHITIVLIIAVYSPYLFLAFFIYVMMELVFFFKMARKNVLYPEKNKLLSMKYWPSTKKRKSVISHLFSLIVSISLGFTMIILDFYFFELLIATIILFSFYPIVLGVMFIMAIVTIKGSMESFESRYSERIHEKSLYYFVFFPIPWIILMVIFFFSPRGTTDFFITFTNFYFLFIYLFIGIIGLVAIPKKKWRSSYTISQVSATYTFLFAMLTPFFIGYVIQILGSFISFLALGFFFIQGTLDEKGDDLRKYYMAWDKKLKKFFWT